MTKANHDVARRFFEALSAGDLPDDLLTEDMQAWTVTSNSWSPAARFQGGIRMLGSVFDGGLSYTIGSLTAEEDRVAAEVRSEGTLVNGEAFANEYLFLLRIADGKIASVREFANPDPVREKLTPLIQAMMSRKDA